MFLQLSAHCRLHLLLQLHYLEIGVFQFLCQSLVDN